MGKPVSLCKRYYDDGADEVRLSLALPGQLLLHNLCVILCCQVVFLNITSFRQGVLDDLPMLQVLEAASQNVFVPLTVGGGIREYVDADGKVPSTAKQFFYINLCSVY